MVSKTMTVAFRTTPDIKEKAEALFNSLGMNLSSAIDMFLHQAVKENRYPCSLDSKIVSSRVKDMTSTYPAGFFDLFGTLPDLEVAEPEEIPYGLDSKREPL
ncbi:MAG: type II toxin-antitoxin system RelB/DinJ family antitoxin [Treponemataceae bacterium]|nr:type II toxin-antitoxin system RelB/DinJ family antitoxin [Treponemataceae bacterium]